MSAYIGEIILVGFNFAPSGWAFCHGQLLPIAEYEALFSLIGTTYGGDGQSTFALPDLRGRVPVHQGTGPGLSSRVIGESTGTEAVTLTVPQMPTHTHALDASGMTITERCKNGPPNTSSPANAVWAIEPSVPTFTDPTITAGSTPLKAVHITEMRTQVNAVRATFGLGQFNFTDSTITPGSTRINAQHIIDLRTALAQAYSAAGQVPPTYATDPSLTAGTPIKAAHVTQLRSAIMTLSATPYSPAGSDSNMNGGAISLGGTPTAAPVGGAQPHDNMQPYLVLNYCISLFGVFPSQS